MDQSSVDSILVPGSQIRGQVLDEALRPIDASSVSIVDGGDSPAETNQWGWFQFSGSYAGPIRIQVAAKGFASTLVQIEANSETSPLDIV